MLILNTDLVQDFLKDIAFLDSKRPYTKKILKRIDIQKCLSILSFDELLETEEYLNLPNNINISDFEYYKDKYN